MRLIAFTLALAIYLTPGIAYAYTGPGLGLGAIVAVLAVIFSTILAVVAVFWYPLKRLLKKRKEPSRTDANARSTSERDGADRSG